jgi:hypothetical protein
MCYSLLTAIDRKMLTLLEELKQQGRQTQALLRQILNSQGAASKDTVQAELPDDVVFPLGSVDAMREMESLLCRQEIYRRVVCTLFICRALCRTKLN